MSIQTILNKWVGKKRDDCLEKDEFCDGHQEGYNQALAELRSKIPQMEKEILKYISKKIVKYIRKGEFAGSFSDGCECQTCNIYEKKVIGSIINQLKSK